ncbi:MAG: hypothetical protein EPO61_15570 [Nitrospirae bacterium]|nr:MAG: hypothetical protein EPO61_15570 [Nitrospirota bacterium]
MRSRPSPIIPLLLIVLLCTAPACGALSHERLVYNERDVQIGTEHDPSTSSSPPTVLNSHPARLTVEDIRALLSSVQVSGWSGMVGGLLRDPTPIPLLKEEELNLVAKPLVSALSQARPDERVFFSVPNLAVRYNEDRTAGSLFIRGPYLHLTLQDHTAFVRTDTAGGEDYKDPRDFKGMHLWLARPAQPASLSPADTPAWGPFEKVHISMKIQDVLAARSLPIAAQTGQPVPQVPAAQLVPVIPTLPTSKGSSGAPTTAESAEDLRLMLRELSSANLELRSRLKDQAQDMQSLKDELAKLKQELTDSKPKAKSRRKPAAPQQ